MDVNVHSAIVHPMHWSCMAWMFSVSTSHCNKMNGYHLLKTSDAFHVCDQWTNNDGRRQEKERQWQAVIVLALN